eukprot:s1802_g21.t1
MLVVGKPGAELLDLDLAQEVRKQILQVQSALQDNRCPEDDDGDEPRRCAGRRVPADWHLISLHMYIGVPTDPDAEWQHFLQWRGEQSCPVFCHYGRISSQR